MEKIELLPVCKVNRLRENGRKECFVYMCVRQEENFARTHQHIVKRDFI